ncbi:hypothetical protein [Sinorhizobium fredii]|uniref:Peptidase M41 domain-containing protein n=1 Tax=Rhizobium fredii TaxID=380 RepID=A0A2L0H521_RHIFR|nr:hypothetical protein [Sinorhizobium fredii]AUX76292.1 hypothetical protein NXT3_CH01720 [Sinorhizobium fredii]
MTKPTPSEIALHEAAHVLAAIRNGIGVLHVSLDVGEVILEPPGDSLEQGHHYSAVAAGYAIVALAGRAAAPETGLSEADQLLLQHALFLASLADPPDEMCHAFSTLAEHFVLKHRDEIEHLAGVLDRRRAMTGAELAEIFRRCGGHD